MQQHPNSIINYFMSAPRQQLTVVVGIYERWLKELDEPTHPILRNGQITTDFVDSTFIWTWIIFEGDKPLPSNAEREGLRTLYANPETALARIQRRNYRGLYQHQHKSRRLRAHRIKYRCLPFRTTT